jgi:hypothetical protein
VDVQGFQDPWYRVLVKLVYLALMTFKMAYRDDWTYIMGKYQRSTYCFWDKVEIYSFKI